MQRSRGPDRPEIEKPNERNPEAVAAQTVAFQTMRSCQPVFQPSTCTTCFLVSLFNRSQNDSIQAGAVASGLRITAHGLDAKSVFSFGKNDIADQHGAAEYVR